MTIHDLVPALRTQLAAPLPGVEAQAIMAPYAARTDPSLIAIEGKVAREAATLVLLYPLGDGEPALVLTVRQPGLRDHSGQVSFPGGRIEVGETPEVAALREGHEEIGLDPAQPQILGRLTPLYIPPSRFSVYPIVAAMDVRPPFTPQEAEVAALLEVPLALLLSEQSRRTSRRTIRDIEYDVPHFWVDGYEVWGATAMMLAEFVAILEEAYRGTGSMR